MKSNALHSLGTPLFRRLSSSLFVTMLSCLGGIAATTARAEIALDARIGFGQSAPSTSRYRPGSWTPITVYLTGQGVRGVGQLTVTVQQNGNRADYIRKISLHEGPLNETAGFVFNYNASNGMRFSGNSAPDISVQLALDGRQLARRTFALPLSTASETYNILALTRDGSGMNFLNGKKLGLIHRGYDPAQLVNRSGVAPTGGQGSYGVLRDVATSDLFYMDPHALPVSAQGYDMVDAIALADLPLDNLTEDQTTALRDYVRGGGLLILSGGGDLARLKSQFYQDLLPIQPASVETVRENGPEIALLQARYHQPMALRDGAALTLGTLKPDARTLFGSAGKGTGSTGYGLIAARPYGCGTVIFTAFDYLAPEFRSWKQAPSLWRDLLRSGANGLSPRTVMAAQSINRNQNSSSALADALAGKQASSAPPFYVVAIFLGVYIFLLVPASYFLLKKLDKRELAWFTVPGLVMCFTIISYLIALSIKGAALTVNRVVVMETQANSDQAVGLGEMTLYSPRRASFDIAPAPAGESSRSYHNVVPDEIFLTNDGAGSNITVEQDAVPVIRQAEVRLWDKRSFSTPIAASLGGPVAITAAFTKSGEQDSVHVTITNRTRFTLRDCALVNEKAQKSDVMNLGVLAPGETREVKDNFLWSSENTARMLHLPPVPTEWQMVLNVNGSQTQTPAQVRNSLKFGLTQMLTGASAGYSGPRYGEDSALPVGQADNAFVAWVDPAEHPLLDTQVDGKPAFGAEAALLYVHMPMPGNAPLTIARAANPFLENAELNILEEKPSPGGHGIIPR